MENSPEDTGGDGASAGQAARSRFQPSTVSIMPEQQVTHVALLRHGEVESFHGRFVRGQLDVELSKRGLEQSRILSEWLALSQPRQDALYSSDLKRCRHLADLVAGGLGLSPRIDTRLREQSMGRWQGRTWDDISIESGALVTAYWDDYVKTVPPGGESLGELEQRVADWWSEIHARHLGERIVVVTHVGVIRSLLCSLLGVALDDALRLAPSVGSFTSLLVSESGAVLESFGERPWSWAPGRVPAHGAEPRGAPPRIALSGSAGTGKTTLGRALAERLGVVFIEEGMRARLEKGLDIRSLSAASFRDLIRELWREQQAQEAAAPDGYVVDRSSLDFAAFWLHYSLFTDRGETDAFFQEMIAATRDYGRILLFPWGVLSIEGDGVRTTNPWLQLRFQTILEGLLERHAPGGVVAHIPAVRDFDARMRAALLEVRP